MGKKIGWINIEITNCEAKTKGIAKSYQKKSFFHRDESNEIREMKFR